MSTFSVPRLTFWQAGSKRRIVPVPGENATKLSHEMIDVAGKTCVSLSQIARKTNREPYQCSLWAIKLILYTAQNTSPAWLPHAGFTCVPSSSCHCGSWTSKVHQRGASHLRGPARDRVREKGIVQSIHGTTRSIQQSKRINEYSKESTNIWPGVFPPLH